MRVNAMGLPVREDQGGTSRSEAAEGRIRRREFIRWAAGLFALGSSVRSPLPAAATPPNRPSNIRLARDEAQRGVPLSSLQEPVRSKVRQIVAYPTVFRRMPIEVVPCDPDLYVFLVRYPEIVVSMWQLMGVTKVTLHRKGPYAYDARDGAGTVSQVGLVYGTREKHLFLAEGYYDGPLLPRRVTGRCAVLLTSTYSMDQNKNDYITNQLDVFLQVDNAGAELVAKTLHPLLGRTVDSNFSETVRFVSQVSHVAESNGPGVQRMVTRLTDVDPSVRERFAQIATTLNQRAIMKAMSDPQPPTERFGELTREKEAVN